MFFYYYCFAFVLGQILHVSLPETYLLIISLKTAVHGGSEQGYGQEGVKLHCHSNQEQKLIISVPARFSKGEVSLVLTLET